MRAGTLGGRSGGSEDEHPLEVPRHGHEAPLGAHFVETAQRKLAESERRLDDAEHRLGRLLAQSVELAAFGRLQPPPRTITLAIRESSHESASGAFGIT